MTRHVLVIPSWYASAYNPTNGGFFRDQCLALKRAGAKVGVVYPELRRLRSFTPRGFATSHFQRVLIDDEGVQTLRFQGWAAAGRANVWIRRAMALRLYDSYAARFGRPDLIHAHGAQAAGIDAAHILDRRGVPYVLTEHSSGFARGLFPAWQRSYLEAAFAGASCLAAVSASLVESIEPYLGGRRDAVEVIPNLVDTDFFDLPVEAPAQRPFTISCVALLNENKQIDVLLRAFARAFGVDDDVELEIGGEGPERPRLEALARELGISSRVRFLGLLPREGVRDVMQRSHLFVLPSRRETFGLVCVEAMACGVPVLSTRSGGPEEIVLPGLGWLVEPGDVGALSAQLQKARAAGPVDEIRVHALRESATSRYGVHTITERLWAMHDRALGVSTA